MCSSYFMWLVLWLRDYVSSQLNPTWPATYFNGYICSNSSRETVVRRSVTAVTCFELYKTLTSHAHAQRRYHCERSSDSHNQCRGKEDIRKWNPVLLFEVKQVSFKSRVDRFRHSWHSTPLEALAGKIILLACYVSLIIISRPFRKAAIYALHFSPSQGGDLVLTVSYEAASRAKWSKDTRLSLRNMHLSRRSERMHHCTPLTFTINTHRCWLHGMTRNFPMTIDHCVCSGCAPSTLKVPWNKENSRKCT